MSEPPEKTGHPDVDAALDAVVALEERPVAEHLAAYERAHALLRQALFDTPGGPSPEPREGEEAAPATPPAGLQADVGAEQPFG